MIREALPQDAEIVEELYKILVPQSKNIAVLPERIDQIKNDDNNFLFVFDQDKKILGTVFLTICLDPMYQFRAYGVVENLIVREEDRGVGIGRALLDYVEEVCVSKSCSKIMILSNSKREKAHKFFEANGYNGSVSKGFKNISEFSKQ